MKRSFPIATLFLDIGGVLLNTDGTMSPAKG